MDVRQRLILSSFSISILLRSKISSTRTRVRSSNSFPALDIISSSFGHLKERGQGKGSDKLRRRCNWNRVKEAKKRLVLSTSILWYSVRESFPCVPFALKSRVPCVLKCHPFHFEDISEYTETLVSKIFKLENTYRMTSGVFSSFA